MTEKKYNRCAVCEALLSPGVEHHFDLFDPTKQFCCRKCYYTDYLAGGPRDELDKEVIFPAFEIAEVPRPIRLQLLLALDDWIHSTAKYKGQKDVFNWHDQFFDIVVKTYDLQKWQYVLITLISFTPWMM